LPHLRPASRRHHWTKWGQGFTCLLLVVSVAVAHGEPALDRLGADDVATVAGAVTELETSSDPDALFAAGRACEDTLHDPGRALRIYDRLLVVAPRSNIAIAAERRGAQLRAQLGPRGEHAAIAAELATLVANADRRTDVEATARRLAEAAWPGAPDAALWLAEWMRERKRFAEATAAYETVLARWPGSKQAATAQRGRVGVAIDAKQWARALALAEALPALSTIDALERDDLIAAAVRGRRKDRAYVAAWIALAVIGLGLATSLTLAIRRARRRPRIPTELIYLAPIAAVFVAISFTAHRAIAPAVLVISLGGVVLATLSGATLDLVPRSRVRLASHAVACVVAVVALVYVAMMREGLFDMLVETVRFGPDG